MSAPLVSGLAGLIRADDSALTDEEVRTKITQGADDISSENPKYAGQLGAGRINAFRSLGGSTSLEPENGAFAVKLFPNPAQSTIHLISAGVLKAPLDLSVYNSQGKVLLRKPAFLTSGNERKKLNARHLAPGIYMMMLKNDYQQLFRKLIIKDP